MTPKYPTTHLRDWLEWIKPIPLDVRLQQRTTVGAIPKTRPDLNRCLLWTGTIASTGYGMLSIFDNTHKKRKVSVHRLAYELAKGEIPNGLDIDHLCSNKVCVNPDHMEPVTRFVNFLRANTNAIKTHCPKGHPYSPENTYLKKGRYGFRRLCKECAKTWERQRRIGSPYPHRWRIKKSQT